MILYYCIKEFVNSVKWNHCGDKIATASDDATAKVFDFKTGKQFSEHKTGDGSNQSNYSSFLFYSSLIVEYY